MADFTQVREHLRQNALLAAEAAAQSVVARMKAEAPRDTGRLEDSIHYELVDAGGAILVEFLVDAPYAKFQDEGTQGPYLIEGSPILQFVGADDGEILYRHEVRHFGVPATGFATDNIKNFSSYFEQLLGALQ